MSKIILFDEDLDNPSEKAIKEMKEFSDNMNKFIKESKIQTIAVFGHYTIIKNI